MPADDNSLKRGVGLGVFDGCHSGHSALFYALTGRCEELGITPAIFTFRKHPSVVTGDNSRISDGILTDREEKEKLLNERGVETIIYQDFTKEFSQYDPEEFLDRFILRECKAALVVAGYNFRFGKNRTGDTELLSGWGEKNGVEVIIVEPVTYRGESVSSSAIRRYIRNGLIACANGMLGRNYSLKGSVIPGQGLGKKIGFPTANFFPGDGMCVPGNGIYATRLYCDGTAYDSVTNVGVRPSVPGRTDKPIIETMILNETVELYDKEIRVEFLKKLRDEKKFDSVDELRIAIGTDVSEASAFHSDAPDFYELRRIGEISLMGLKTSKFTTDILTVSITLPIDIKNASEYRLLSRVLTASCRKYPSRNLLINRMNFLYGAMISCLTVKTGNALSVEFSADALHSWHGDNYSFSDAAELLFDVIGDPDLDEQGLFREDIVEAEKAGLISEIRARENDKMKYALDKAMSIYAEGTVYAARAFGDAEMVAELDRKSLRVAYDRMIRNGAVLAGITGRYDKAMTDRIADHIRNTFHNNKPEKRIVPGAFPHDFYRKGEFIERREIRDVEQAKVCLICEDMTDHYSQRKSENVLLNELLGGHPDSLLFRVVREELGLAYSVFSMNVSTMNALIMMAGVAHENAGTAQAAMEEQLERIRNGDFEESLMESAKKSLRSSFLQSADSQKELLNNGMSSIFRGRYTLIQDLIYEIENVGKDDLCRKAAGYRPAVKFCVTGNKQKKTGRQD